MSKQELNSFLFMFEREDGFESPLRKQSGGLFLGRGSGVLTHRKH